MDDILEYFKKDELAASTWKNKYAAKGERTPVDTLKRLAREFARIEDKYNWKDTNKMQLSYYGYMRPPLTEESIYALFEDFKKVIPGGSVLAGCGTGELVSLSNCFVTESPKDSYAEIMRVRSIQAQLMKRRGGVGYDLSLLRPEGASVNNAAKSSTGPVSFMEVNSAITNEVAQGGRRGALMLSIHIKHPDSLGFIKSKQDLSKITGANISVKIGDDFMKAVEKDEDYILRFPIDTTLPDNLDLSTFEYNVLYTQKEKEDTIYLKKIKAKEYWDTLMECAHNTAEPGIMFEDTMHNSPDGVYEDFKGISTNPCGEIFMGAYDSCRLIHLNLTSVIDDPFTDKASINEDELYALSYEITRLADDIVDLEIESCDRILKAVEDDENPIEYELWSTIKQTALSGRRSGVGFTGLADAIAMLGLKYDSEESLIVIDQMMRIMFCAQLDSTTDMAIERGAFPVFDSSKEYSDFSVPNNGWYSNLLENYPQKAKKMMAVGRRNISWSTVAPTGTVSIMAGCSSGIEPVFLPFYERKRKCMSEFDRVDYIDIKGEKYTLFTVVHPKLKDWANISLNYSEEEISTWDIATWKLLWKDSPYYNSTAPEISWDKRVSLQGIVQQYITHSISSTVNLPNETTQQEISDIYYKAWKVGNKGQTVYRDGCREGVLNKVVKPTIIEERQSPKRPKELEADYYQIKVKGEQFIVLVGLLEDKPYEVFAFRPLHPVNIDSHKGKITKVSKMHYSFESEFIKLSDIQLVNTNIEEIAATLYSSMLLRHGVAIEHIVKTAKKVNENISSFSSAMCRILSKYNKAKEVKGEVCPECGSKLIRDAGCIRCADCSFSKCG